MAACFRRLISAMNHWPDSKAFHEPVLSDNAP
ncbi:hypothetical protein Cabther_A1431 [Chloracidobacterium thermophilum B]|uniref:Uncharacterized protein n=1 Tax=Chloracidobacterium thermophilum (strain B) TaxID=981222 RepID=G2LHB9_CHLTF|nr:hypothetical protein Cabther_A1431 [Chloracidobacterium thermophilum B]